MLTETTYDAQPLEALDDDAELQARLVRKALKKDFHGRITYTQGDYIQGVATAKNLGFGDILLHLNRYIGEGEAIHIQLDCLTYRGLPIQMDAEVAECRPARGKDGFTALVYVRKNAPTR